MKNSIFDSLNWLFEMIENFPEIETSQFYYIKVAKTCSRNDWKFKQNSSIEIQSIKESKNLRKLDNIQNGVKIIFAVFK